jgi:aerobic-type carbon monoxide dehydrogenase small subunit (CoxS/CutS family)
MSTNTTDIEIRTSVNGMTHTTIVAPRLTVAEYLRDNLGLTGTKTSCELEVCGVCSVLVNGLPVSACASLATDLDGHEVTTVEGLANGAELNHLQQAFVEGFAVQCGFCTPGFLVMATALLNANPDPTREEVIEYLEGNICRCTGYRPIIDSILVAAKRMRDES